MTRTNEFYKITSWKTAQPVNNTRQNYTQQTPPLLLNHKELHFNMSNAMICCSANSERYNLK